MTSGGRGVASWAAAMAARIMAAPPSQWTLRIITPGRTTARLAPATVLGMSLSLRSRKTSPPAALIASTTWFVPTLLHSSRPTLKPAHVAPKLLDQLKRLVERQHI